MGTDAAKGRALRTMLSIVLAALMVLVSACSGDDDDPEPRDGDQDEPDGPDATSSPVEPVRLGSFDALIPRPTEVASSDGEFVLSDATVIVIEETAEDEGVAGAAALLAGYLGPATGLPLSVSSGDEDADSGDSGDSQIVFRLADDPAERDELGDEGYELAIRPTRVEVVAATGAGFGWAVQTIRQILPPESENATAQPGTVALPAGSVRDIPRFAWRGAMLDVARHFFPPEDVERVIDLLAQYKLNRLHLHLSDDQGWRLQIEQYPELTDIGAATEVGGGSGGFYTREEYRGLVDYAAQRGIVMVPEIDMPGHTTAALASLPWLSCDGTAPEIETGITVTQHALCVDDERTYEFVEAVVAELAPLTPGGWIHFGGDESFETDADEYGRFVTRTAGIIRSAGLVPVGWDEVATTEIGPDTVVQHWASADNARAAAAQGAGVVLSPATHAYMDMKYDSSTPLGLEWAGPTDTRDAYEWDPATVVADLPIDRVLGVEAPLWTETITTLAEIEQMMLPRLPGYAELGWSSAEGRTWDEYQTRLVTHAARWTAAGRSFTVDPVVPWP